MTVSRVTAVLTLTDGTKVAASSARLRLDEGYVPSVQADDITVAYDPAWAAALDPRAFPPPRITLTLVQTFNGSMTLDELSVEWAGLTIADLSTMWAGMTLTQVSLTWGEIWDPDVGYKPPITYTANLGLRTRVIDYAAATITVSAASDEVQAMDIRRGGGYGVDVTLADYAVYMLDRAGIVRTGVNFTLGEGVILTPAESNWDLDDGTVWDKLAHECARANLRLTCDGDRFWRMSNPDPTTPVGTLSLPRVIAARDTTSRDGEWADECYTAFRVITTDGTVVDGIDGEAHAGVYEGSHRTLWVHRELPEIPADYGTEAEARLRRAQGRDRQLVITAPIDLTARPGVLITTGAPSLPELDAVATAVEWLLPDDVMNVTTRDTNEPGGARHAA